MEASLRSAWGLGIGQGPMARHLERRHASARPEGRYDHDSTEAGL